jgi:hypothetical protein
MYFEPFRGTAQALPQGAERAVRPPEGLHGISRRTERCLRRHETEVRGLLKLKLENTVADGAAELARDNSPC